MFTAFKCFYMYLAWRWLTWAEKCFFNKHQNSAGFTVKCV